MNPLTIHLSEEKLKQLKKKADLLNTTPESLIQASIDDLLTFPDEAFEQALAHVLKKNQDLYRRLAEGA